MGFPPLPLRRSVRARDGYARAVHRRPDVRRAHRRADRRLGRSRELHPPHEPALRLHGFRRRAPPQHRHGDRSRRAQWCAACDLRAEHPRCRRAPDLRPCDRRRRDPTMKLDPGRYALGLAGESTLDLVRAVERAEAAGFHSAWSTELHHTAFVPLAAAAMRTTRIQLGTGIALAFVRSPLITALTALDLDELSDGRAILGLGTDLVRLFLRGVYTNEPLRFTGEYYDIDVRGYQRPGKPVRERLPIYIAAVGPAMTRLAGEIGDGWLRHELNSPRYFTEMIWPNLQRGLQRAGREREQITLCASLLCAPNRDRVLARRAAAAQIAFYASVRTYAPFFAFHGFGSEATRIQERFRAGDRGGMLAAVSEAMIDCFAAAGTPDEVRRALGRYGDTVDIVKLSAPSHDIPPEETAALQEGILDLFA